MRILNIPYFALLQSVHIIKFKCYWIKQTNKISAVHRTAPVLNLTVESDNEQTLTRVCYKTELSAGENTELIHQKYY